MNQKSYNRIWRLRGRTPAKADLKEIFVAVTSKSNAGIEYTKYVSKLVPNI